MMHLDFLLLMISEYTFSGRNIVYLSVCRSFIVWSEQFSVASSLLQMRPRFVYDETV